MFANIYGLNTPTRLTDYKIPSWCRWTWSWADIHSWLSNPVPASSHMPPVQGLPPSPKLRQQFSYFRSSLQTILPIVTRSFFLKDTSHLFIRSLSMYGAPILRRRAVIAFLYLKPSEAPDHPQNQVLNSHTGHTSLPGAGLCFLTSPLLKIIYYLNTYFFFQFNTSSHFIWLWVYYCILCDIPKLRKLLA